MSARLYASLTSQRDRSCIGLIQPAGRHIDSQIVQEIGADIGKQTAPAVSQIGKRGFGFCGYISRPVRNDGSVYYNPGCNVRFLNGFIRLIIEKAINKVMGRLCPQDDIPGAAIHSGVQVFLAKVGILNNSTVSIFYIDQVVKIDIRRAGGTFQDGALF